MKKNRVVYILALLIAMVFVYITEKDVAYVMLYVLVVLPMLSFLYCFLAMRGLSIRHFFRHSAITKGDESDIIIMAENHGLLVANDIELVFAEAEPGVVMPDVLFIKSVGRKGVVENVVKYSCKYRGQYFVGVDYIRMFDALKLFVFKKQVQTNDSVLVYPRSFPLTSLPIKAELSVKQNAHNAAILNDNYTIADIRKYVPSDSLKKVHWKLSAKRNELLVKRFQASGSSVVVAIVDTNRLLTQSENKIAYEDSIMSYVLSYMKYMTDRQICTDLVYASDVINTIACDGIKAFNMLKTVLAKATFDTEIPPEEILMKILKNKDEFVNIVLFTANLTDLVRQSLINAKNLGHNVVLIYFDYIKSRPSSIKELEAEGIYCFNIQYEEYNPEDSELANQR